MNKCTNTSLLPYALKNSAKCSWLLEHTNTRKKNTHTNMEMVKSAYNIYLKNINKGNEHIPVVMDVRNKQSTPGQQSNGKSAIFSLSRSFKTQVCMWSVAGCDRCAQDVQKNMKILQNIFC